MIWMFLLAVVMGFVFYKLGVLTVMFALLQGLLKLLFVLWGCSSWWRCGDGLGGGAVELTEAGQRC